jgi:hypothetical protein
MTRLPLPLELTKPVLLAGDLDTQLRATLTTDYDAKTQLTSGGGSNTTSNNNTKSYDKGLIVIDLKLDVQVDDVLG